MGYCSDFKISLKKYQDNQLVDYFNTESLDKVSLFKMKFEEITGYNMEFYRGLISLNDVKFYDYDEDLTKLSEIFPNILIELEKHGEESEDILKAIYFNGKSVTDTPKFIYEKLDNEDFVDNFIKNNISNKTININPEKEILEKELETAKVYFDKLKNNIANLPETEELIEKITDELSKLFQADIEIKFPKKMLSRKEIIELYKIMVIKNIEEKINKIKD